MHFPEIHIIENNGQSLGLCVERPFLFKMSEEAKAVLRLHSAGHTNDDMDLKPLLGQYEQSDIQQTLDEFTSLEKKIRAPIDGLNGSTVHPQILSLEVLSGSIQELEMIKKSIHFLLQGLGVSKIGTIILDLHCALSCDFYEIVWKFGTKLARKQSKHLKMVLRIPLLSLDGEIISAVKAIPVGIQLVITADNPCTNLPASVKTDLERLLLETHPVGVIEKSNESQGLINFQTLSQKGIGVIHQGVGVCAFFCGYPESHISISNRNDSPTYSAPSETLKYLSSLVGSIPSEYHCGAGRWYLAVSSSGKIYPCHRFINNDRFLAGHIDDTSLDTKVYSQFEGIPVSKKAACQKCWARHLCGGGCAYDAICNGEPLNGINDSACANIKHNIEQAAVLFTGMDDASRTMAEKLNHTMVTTIPYWQACPPKHKTDSISFISSGDSMLPLIKNGATLTTEYIHPRHLRIGEIFTYRKGQKIVTHRLMGRMVRDGKLFLLEKGDNAFFAKANGAEVIGRVILLKNQGMSEAVNLDALLWRFGNTLIVVLVMTLWVTYFICRFGGVILIHILKHRRSTIKAIRATVRKVSLYQNSQWFLTVTNRLTQLITRLLFSIYSWEI